MEKIEDIHYNIITYIKDVPYNRLEINIKGKNIDSVIVNSIRRAILTYIPIYAFTKFNFTANESIFNNNYIKLRLNNLPILGITNNVDKITPVKKLSNINEEEYETLNIELEDDIEMENTDSINVNTSLNQLTMYVDYKSTDKAIVTVTTDDVKFYYGEKNISSPYKTPIPIIKLQSEQSISFSAISTLGTETDSSIYSAVSVCFFKENNDNDFDLILESRGQLTEDRIIEVAILNLISVIENISGMIPEDQIGHSGEIIINGENNTIGNLFSHCMQNHKSVKFAGYNIPHLLANKVVIHYELINDTIKLINVIDDITIYLIKLFNKILLLNKNMQVKK
jgi:DNA-directed RNA polymerase subunit L